MSGFYNDIVPVITQTHQHAKDFIEAAKSTVFVRQEVIDPAVLEATKRQAGAWANEVGMVRKPSPGVMFDATRKELEGAIAAAERALQDRWEMMRDERHNTPENAAAFARGFESNVVSISNAVSGMVKGVDTKHIRATPAVTRHLKVLCEDVSHMVSVYEAHGEYDNLKPVRGFLRGPGAEYGTR